MRMHLRHPGGGASWREGVCESRVHGGARGGVIIWKTQHIGNF